MIIQIIITISSILAGVIPFFGYGIRESATLDMLHLIIIVINSVSVFLLYQKRHYSLFKILHLFSYFFFGVVPILLFKENIIFFGASDIDENIYIHTSLLIVTILILYNILYYTFNKHRIPLFLLLIYNSFFSKKLLSSSKKPFWSLIILSCLAFIVVFSYNDFDYVQLFHRDAIERVVELLYSDNSKVDYLFINSFIRPISAVTFIFSYFYKANKTTIIFLFILLIATCSPTGVPRYFVAAIYLPIVILIYPTLRKKNIFPVTMIFGLMVIFPFLENFRYIDQEAVNINFDVFKTPHFDSYTNFAQIIDLNLISNGYQLLGVIFFFIPRSLWVNKPIGSGAELAEQLQLSFHNISCNFFAEGYINFGYAGVFLFVFIIAYVTAMFDKLYWSSVDKFKSNFFSTIYLMYLGLFFFMLRGDLLSSWGFAVSLTATVVLVYKIYA